MSPALDQVATTLMWLLVFAPLIFAGLLLAIDPSGFREALQSVAKGIERFQAQLRTPWQLPLLPSERAGPAPRADAALRLLGLAAVAAGLLGLLEVLR